MPIPFSDNQKLFLEALEASCGIVSEAAEKCGLSRHSHYAWMRVDPDYVAAVEELQNLMLDLAESCLKKNMRAGDTAAATFVLKYKGKKRGYIDKQEVDVNHSGTIKFEFGNSEEVTDENV